MRLALFQPDIAGNVGAILRTAACFSVAIDLIEPLGFAWDDKRVRRAGMDYADRVAIDRHRDWPTFVQTVSARLILLTTHGDTALHDFAFETSDVLLMGSESAGAPVHVHHAASATLRIPIAPGLRSLNVSVAAAIALSEALRQTGGLPT